MVKVVHYKCACFYFFFILRESRKLSLSFPVGMQLNIWIGKFLSEYIGISCTIVPVCLTSFESRNLHGKLSGLKVNGMIVSPAYYDILVGIGMGLG